MHSNSQTWSFQMPPNTWKQEGKIDSQCWLPDFPTCIGARAVHKVLMFDLCCSLYYLLFRWISEAPVQQHLHLQLKLLPFCLRMISQILPWIDQGQQCWWVLAIVPPIISSEGRIIFITETWIWFHGNDPGYFKHFKLFGCSVYNLGIFGRIAWWDHSWLCQQTGGFLTPHGGNIYR